LRVAGAVEVLIELARFLDGRRLEIGNLLVDRLAVPDVALRIRVEMARHLARGDQLRLALLIFDLREPRRLERLELRRRERRLAQDLRHQRERGGQVLLRGLDLQVRLRGASADTGAGLQAIELFANRLPRVLRRPPHQHRAGHARVGGLAEQALLVAEAERRADDHRAATRFLRQEGDLEAVLELNAPGSALDVLRGGIERFAGGDDRVAFVILDERVDVRRGRNRRAIGLVGRDVDADGAVARL